MIALLPCCYCRDNFRVLVHLPLEKHSFVFFRGIKSSSSKCDGMSSFIFISASRAHPCILVSIERWRHLPCVVCKLSHHAPSGQCSFKGLPHALIKALFVSFTDRLFMLSVFVSVVRFFFCSLSFIPDVAGLVRPTVHATYVHAPVLCLLLFLCWHRAHACTLN